MGLDRIMRISRLFVVVCFVLGAASATWAAGTLPLWSPTPDQIVREKVRITIPVSALPSEMFTPSDQKPPEKKRPFVSIEVEDSSKRFFVCALSADVPEVRAGKAIFYWDSKAAYRDPDDPKKDKFFKDGKYTIHVTVHGPDANAAGEGSVVVHLRNKVARPNPAPAVSLVNRLAFGQSRHYGAHADVQVFETVSGMGLPVLGGLGMTSDFKVIQTVDDIRNDGTLLMRYRIDKGARISLFGKKRTLYEADDFGPQLYRLVTKFGKVVKRNVFARQAQYTITDILPVLPYARVKEGDSWPCTMTLKIEGITNQITFAGTSMLDSFEWQGGHECAKIVSRLTGTGAIMINGGKIRSSSPTVVANAITYFAYKSGTLLQNEVTLDFPALIMPGADEPGSESEGESNELTLMTTAIPPDIEEDEVFRRPTMGRSGTSASGGAGELGAEGGKKGSVQIKLVVRLEK